MCFISNPILKRSVKANLGVKNKVLKEFQNNKGIEGTLSRIDPLVAAIIRKNFFHALGMKLEEKAEEKKEEIHLREVRTREVINAFSQADVFLNFLEEYFVLTFFFDKDVDEWNNYLLSSINYLHPSGKIEDIHRLFLLSQWSNTKEAFLFLRANFLASKIYRADFEYDYSKEDLKMLEELRLVHLLRVFVFEPGKFVSRPLLNEEIKKGIEIAKEINNKVLAGALETMEHGGDVISFFHKNIPQKRRFRRKEEEIEFVINLSRDLHFYSLSLLNLPENPDRESNVIFGY